MRIVIDLDERRQDDSFRFRLEQAVLREAVILRRLRDDPEPIRSVLPGKARPRTA